MTDNEQQADAVVVEAATLEAALEGGAAALGIAPAAAVVERVAEHRQGLLSFLGIGPTVLRARVVAAPPPPRPGRFALAYHGGALRIVVTPAAGGASSVSGADVRAITAMLGADAEHDAWIDEQTAAATARPFALPDEAFESESAPPPAVVGTACAIVQPDRLAAWLVATSFEPDRPVAAADIVEALDAAGVAGDRRHDVIKAIDGHTLPHPVIVAVGRAAKHGSDAVIETHLDREPATDADADEEAVLDFRDVHHASYVHEHDVLAHKLPPTAGEAGVTVLGEELAATDGADADLTKLVGKNTKLGEWEGHTEHSVVAAVSGNARLSGQKIDIEPALAISGHVDFHTGNIDFPGPVTVQGDVESGFELKAGGDVVIGGSVDGGRIIAGGNVSIRGGFLAEAEGQHGHIEAAGDVRADLVIGGVILAGGTVSVAKEIVRADIQAGRAITVDNGGQVRGARLIAGGSISAGVIGGRLGARTVVAAGSGLDPNEIRRLLRSDLEAGASGDAQPIAGVAQPASPNDADAAAADATAGERAPGDDDAGPPPNGADQDDDDEPADTDVAARPRITISDHVEPGVLLAVGGARLRVEEPIQRCALVDDGQTLVTLPLP